MCYYLLRKTPNKKTTITAAEAIEWDVTMILKSNSLRIIPGILYHDKNMNTFYVQQVEEYAYDMMNALDFPHATRKKLWIVVPQEIFTSTTHSTVARGTSARIFIHTTQIVGPFEGTASGMQLHECMGEPQ